MYYTNYYANLCLKNAYKSTICMSGGEHANAVVPRDYAHLVHVARLRAPLYNARAG